MQLARTDRWVEIVLTWFEDGEKSDWYGQELYADNFAGLVSKVVAQLVGQICRFVHTWEPEELEVPSKITESSSKDDRKPKVLRRTRQAT